MEFLVFAILFTATGAQESQLEGPQNAVNVVGSNVTLKCLSPSSNCILTEWLKYSAGNPMTIFNHVGIISIAYRERYKVNNKSGCHLIIENVQLTDAGRFLCRALISSSTIERTAHLIILETEPKCTTNASLDDTVEGDEMHMTCEVTYHKINRTSMVWKGVEDDPAAVTNGNTISRSFSVVASAPEVSSFTCATSFALEIHNNGVPIKGVATNIPVATCQTPTVRVLYSVRDVQLSQSFSDHSPGSVITCMAKGHPSPTFKWQELENNDTWIDIQNQSGSQFSVRNVTSKRYRCVAMNIIKGRTYHATSRELQIYNPDVLSTSIAATTSEDRLGIGIGIGLLSAILLGSIVFAILIRFRCLQVHPRPANKPLDGVVQHKEQEINPSSSHQLSVMHPSTHRIGAPLVGEQESAYASLGEDRDTNEYAALELKQKATSKKK